MKTLELKGAKRETLGKKESKKLREQELVPAVLYGGEEAIHFSIPFSDLRKLVYSPNVYLIDLEIDGNLHRAIVQDIQWHPVEEQMLHIDFLEIFEDKPVKVSIPIKVKGLAKGIKAGGKLKTNLRKLKVKALANDLPDLIEIDITKLNIGQSIKVGDLQKENLEFLDSKSNVVVGVITTRAAKSAPGMAIPDDDESEDDVQDTTEETSEEQA